MQSVTWYLHRLRAMSPAEVYWRVESAWRDRVDSARILLGALPDDSTIEAEAERLASPAPPRLTDVPRGAWAHSTNGSLERQWHTRLCNEADAILAHRVRIFGVPRDLGRPIAWNRDHERHLDTPMDIASSIDYRDQRRAGDAKIVWEPNRHQHLVVLARAYRATGKSEYAQAVVEQLLSWIECCPFGRGMNWRSPLELAIRLINWTWALDLIRDANCLSVPVCRRILTALHLHLWDVSRKFSRGSSANNHLIGEAAGVFVATCYFDRLCDAAALRDRSVQILSREIEAQIHVDGGTREQATAYHLFVLNLHLVAGLSGRALGCELPSAFWAGVERMMGFAAALGEGGPLPAFGDADDGYVLDLGRDHDDLAATLAIGAAVFGRRDWRVSGKSCEPVRWLCGGQALEAACGNLPSPSEPLESRALADSGYYVLQRGIAAGGDEISVVFDCGPLGFGDLAAHGHADALSFVVRAFGAEVLVDPGTYDYFTFPDWREYFRSTRAHNTVTVDGLDQSIQLGGFLWGTRAEARCTNWQPATDGGLVAGEHSGYQRLANPVTHARQLKLSGDPATLTVQDDLVLNAPHTIEVRFHLGIGCQIGRLEDHVWELRIGRCRVRVELDRNGTWSCVRGQEQPIGGWVSAGYHLRQPSTTIVGTFHADRPLTALTRFTFHQMTDADIENGKRGSL